MRKVKIAFLDIVGLKYDGDTLNKRGLGGSESATIYMSKELYKLGFDVTVFCKAETEGVFDGVKFKSNSYCANNTEEFDILVSLRSCVPYIPIQYRDAVLQETGYDIAYSIGLINNSKYKVLWLHDTFCKGDNWLEHITIDGYIDDIFTLSDWHSNYILNGHKWRDRHFEVLKNKIWQTRNGIKRHIDEVDISKKDKNTFVYNASVSKGMTPLLEKCWPKIKEQIPDAKLIIIGGFYRGANNDKPDEQELQWMKLKENHDGKDGVTFTGVISQQEIAKILSTASLTVFPNEFPETFGISTLESINYNTPVVTCRFGALEEVALESSCYLINYNIGYNDVQIDRFVNMVVKAYRDDYLRKQKMYACNEVKDISGWDTVALQWKQHFYNKLDLYMSLDELKKVRKINREVQRIFKTRFLNKEDILEHSSENNNFVIVTPVYNAESYIAKCINSVANQLYNKYKMIIIDDMSTDNTVDIALETIANIPEYLRDKFSVKINIDKKYAVTNQVETIEEYAQKNDVIILLDGDDWLVNDNGIFNYLDNIYSDNNEYLMTYGSCHSLVDNIDLISEPYPKGVHETKSYREHLFSWGMPYTHLRTFRKSVFDKIDKSLFKDENGNHWKAGGDNALFYPLLENADEIKCIQRVLMVYNDTNPLNDYKVNGKEQTETQLKIRGMGNKTNMHDLKNIHNNVLNRDEESIKQYKNIVHNRADAWIDDSNAPNIGIRKNWLINKFSELNIDKNVKILDVGSWTGSFINSFYELGYKNISCVELSTEASSLGAKTYPQFKWMCGDIEEMQLNEKYDVIVMFEILEHLVNPSGVLYKLKSYLNENGKIFFSIPTEDYVNHDGMAYEHISYIKKSDIEEFTNDIEIIYNDNFHWYMGKIENKVQDKTKILIAIPTNKNIETDTFKSIYNLIKPNNAEIVFECFYGYNVDQVRNLMAHYTIQNNFDYIFCVDSDVVLPKDALIKLLNHDKELISGIYRQRILDKVIPELYIINDNQTRRAVVDDIEKPQILEVSSCGFGCTLIKKDLLVRIGYPQFEYHASIDFSKTISEDSDFCIKTRKVGSHAYVDTSIKCGHIGSFELKI